MTQTSLLPDLAPSSPFPEGLTGQQLADRLRVNASTISRNLDKWDKQTFAQWSKLSKVGFFALYPNESISSKSKKIPDPDGLAWTKRGDRFYPIS